MRDYISANQISIYSICPLLYKKIYIDGFERAPRLFLSEGKFIHKMVETWFKQQQVMPGFDINQVMSNPEFQKYVIQEMDKLQDYVKLAEGALQELMKRSLQQATTIVTALKDHGITIKDMEYLLEFITNGIKFRGFIDILGEDKRGEIIIDIKTGSRFKRPSDATNSHQLVVYGMGRNAEAGRPIDHPIRVVLLSTNRNQPNKYVWHMRTITTHDVVQTIALAKSIKEAHRLNFFPPTSKDKCPGWCPLREAGLCEEELKSQTGWGAIVPVGQVVRKTRQPELFEELEVE